MTQILLLSIFSQHLNLIFHLMIWFPNTSNIILNLFNITLKILFFTNQNLLFVLLEEKLTLIEWGIHNCFFNLIFVIIYILTDIWIKTTIFRANCLPFSPSNKLLAPSPPNINKLPPKVKNPSPSYPPSTSYNPPPSSKTSPTSEKSTASNPPFTKPK